VLVEVLPGGDPRFGGTARAEQQERGWMDFSFEFELANHTPRVVSEIKQPKVSENWARRQTSIHRHPRRWSPWRHKCELCPQHIQTSTLLKKQQKKKEEERRWPESST
jgi:hypothetical protein